MAYFQGNSVDRLDNTVGVNITEHYAPTIIKTDVDNNTCDLSIVVSREDLLRSIINMNQLGTSETVIQTFWLPNGKSFQFSTTKSNAEKALALMDAYLEDHPDLVSPPIENILNGIEETIASEENTEDTDEPTTTEAEESEAIESTEESQTNAIEESEAIETEEEASEATNETEKIPPQSTSMHVTTYGLIVNSRKTVNTISITLHSTITTSQHCTITVNSTICSVTPLVT